MKVFGLMTHWDWDGCLSEYIIRKAYDIKFSSAQGYGKVFQNVKKLHGKGVTDLLITDLSPTPETLQWCLKNFNSVHLLDHHQETALYEPLVNIAPHFTLDYTDKVCGAVIVSKHIHDLGFKLDKRERKLLQLCNIYDLWKSESKPELWKAAHASNDLFWFYSNQSFWGMLPKLDTLDMDDLSDEDVLEIEANKELRTVTVENAVSHMTETGSIISLLPDKSAVNYVAELMDYTQFDDESNGVYYNIYKTSANSPWNCSIRSRGDLDINIGKTLSHAVKTHDMAENGGGHAKAGGMMFTSSDIHVILEYIENILDEEVINGNK